VPDISIVIPCHDAVTMVRRSVATLTDYLGGLGQSWEIILVDDGSTDGTGAVLDGLADGERIRVVHLPENRGKGRAVAKGMLAARGRYRIFTDVDLPYRLDSIPECVARMCAGAPAVFGNRLLERSDAHVQSTLRRMAGRLVRVVAGMFLGRTDADTQCGFKGFVGPLAAVLFTFVHTDGFLFDVEIYELFARAEIPIQFVPVVLLNQGASSVHLVRTGLRTLGEASRIWRIRRRPATELAALRAAAGLGEPSSSNGLPGAPSAPVPPQIEDP